MTLQILSRKIEKIETEGKMNYSQQNRSWSVIRLRKDIINQFPQLFDRSSECSYKLIFHPTYKELEKAIRKMKREKIPVPAMIFFAKERKVIF